MVQWFFSKKTHPHWAVLVVDCVIVYCVAFMGYVMNHGWFATMQNIIPTLLGCSVILIVFCCSFLVTKTHLIIVRYSTFLDLQRIFLANLMASVLLFLLFFVQPMLNGVILLPSITPCGFLLITVTMFMFLERLSVKLVYDRYRGTDKAEKAMIYGVRNGGIALAKSMRSQDPVRFRLMGFVDPEGHDSTSQLLGVKVYLDNDCLVQHIQKLGVKALFVSPLQSEHFTKRDQLIDSLTDLGVKIMMVPVAQEWDGKSDLNHQQLREVDIEDLLHREKIEVDMDAIGTMLRGKRVLITGAAGSIGSEMARQVAKFDPAELVLIDQAETPMHDVRRYMAANHPQLKCWTIVSSITNPEHMETIFKEHRPEYVFHAAAYKHVPMMEDNPAIAVQNNVYGTRVIADLAVKYDTLKFVMISTDKAVNPTNVMGCSKRICEIYCQSLNNHLWEETQRTGRRTTQFITTRFGNVLGSNGSVIPIFREQIKNGGPVKVTHPDIIRFFMLIPEACRLVLQAGTMGKGGEIFVFDMGEPVKILNLAQRMIKLSGAKDVKIEFTGLRDGEKLYEEVLNDAEQTKPTDNPKIKVAKVREYPYELALKNELELHELSFSFDDMAVVRKMKEIVPEYVSKQSKYEQLDAERAQQGSAEND